MLEKILPEKIKSVIALRLDANRVYELRLRANMPTVINYNGKYYYLSTVGLCEEASYAIVVDETEVNEIIVRACECSLYSVNNQLVSGYITVTGGIRVGVCGEIVKNGNEIKTIKNFTSVNIRIPHEVKGSALTAYSYISDTKLRSSLIVSPPGAGKTTILRDLCRCISRDGIKNILLVDERNEISAVSNGRNQLDVGVGVDIISGCSKDYAFSYGIRSMRPDVIITDELTCERDYLAVEESVAGGVIVIASAHASKPEELLLREGFSKAFKMRIFDRFVFLSSRNGPGTYENIYDGEMNCIYFGL